MDHHAVVLRTLRFSLCIGILLIPAFGVAFAAGGALDLLAVRVAVLCVTALVLALTYVSETVQARPFPIMVGYLSGIMLWIGGLTYLSDLAPEASIGFLFTLFVSGALVGIVSREIRPLAWFLSWISGIGIAVGLATSVPQSNPEVFVLSACAASAILAILSYLRIRERKAREEREQTLQETEHLAAIGSWSHDLRTSRREWSDGLYRLLGIEALSSEPPQVSDYVSPEIIPTLRLAEQRLMTGEADTIDHRYSVYRADGVERHIHSVVRLARSPEGRPIRLIGMVRDITDQVEYEQELEGARAQAEDAAALQKSILANMSHEIRTPLTAVIGYAQLLEEEAGDDLKDLVIPIRTGGERLLDTLNSVLELARMEAGHLEIVAESLDVTQEVHTVVELLSQQAASGGLALHVDAPEAPVYARADARALGRSLTNLISNAIKFTPRGSVTVRVAQDGERVRVDIADTGRGMSAEFQARLFEPFRQESTGSARSHEGTGLGLAITQHMVEAMGGSIAASSTEGVGTTFTFDLPADVPQEDCPPAPPLAWIARPHAARASGESPAPLSAPAPKGQRGDGLAGSLPRRLTTGARADA